ncbi:MAG: hypothetical protein AAFQ54_04300 [Pseudomonadota bacterium]
MRAASLFALLFLSACGVGFPGGGGGPAVPFDGGALAYGDIVVACDTPRRTLGTRVARFPERGRGYSLYDSDPSTTALRPHYITGFPDGCPRKFMAALALFGSANAYETTRVEDDLNTTIFTDTDRQYRAIRARVCGRPVGEACGASRFRALERSAVFVSVYERFGTNPTWADMLIYDGVVVAKDFKVLE